MPRLLLVAGVTATGMFLYEWTKQFLDPEISIWQSHAITIAVSTLIATVSSYFVLARHERLTQRAWREAAARAAAEEARRQSETQYQALFASARDAIFITRDDILLDCNVAGVKLLRCADKAELIGRPVMQFFPATQPDGSDSLARVREKIQAAEAGTPQFFEIRQLRADGTPYDAEVSLSRIEGAQAPPMLLGLVRDITERKQNEAEYRHTAHVLSVLATATAGAIGPEFFRKFVQHLGSVFNATGAFLAELNKSGDRIRTIAVWSPQGELENFEYDLAGTPSAEVLKAGHSLLAEDVMRRYPGAPIIQRLGARTYCGAPVFDAQGRPSGILAILYNTPPPLSNANVRALVSLFAAQATAEINRFRSEQSLQRQAAFDALVTDLLARFTTSTAAELDGLIMHALEQVACFMDAEDIFLALLTPGGTVYEFAYRWHLAGVPEPLPPKQKFEMGTFQWSEQALLRGEVVQFDSVTALPAEAVAEREFYNQHGIRSLLEIPMRGHERVTGAIGVCTFSRQMHWSADDVWHLRIVGDAIGNVLERKRAEERLKDSARRKDEFIAMLGHELRNPLAPIRNASHILKLIATNERTRSALAIIERQAVHLSRIVNDLLDVSRLARGKVTLCRTRLDFARVVQNSVDDHRTEIEAKRLTLRATIAPQPVWIQGDETRLAQVVSNLLHNSQKFTDSGWIAVDLSVDTLQGLAVLTVSDSGIGMSAETLTRVFDPFAQANVDLARTRGGMGLGAALIRGLVELHGGSVSATSPGLGQGSTFRIELPLAERPARKGDSARAGPAAPVPRRGTVKVLVIEDNADASQSLTTLLEMQGYSVTVALDGASGVRLAQQVHPDIILCDIGLPDMDGYAVCRALRADAQMGHVFMVAMTGYGQDEDKRRSREAGFDLHLTKPVDPEVLERVLSEAHAAT